MRAMHGSHPFARSTARPCSWWQRVADLIAALALVVAVTPMALAQPVEIVYNTFSDPNNANDPRAIAQTKMIAEFERQNPNIKVRVVVDPTGANGARTLRIRADSPDVIRATNFQMPEYVATGSLLPGANQSSVGTTPGPNDSRRQPDRGPLKPSDEGTARAPAA